MELRQLEAFVEAARSGSISRAARTLYLTQPSLTQRVRALELDLGQQLLVRAGRGVRLTAAGARFLPKAEAALRTLRNAATELKAMEAVEAGRLATAATTDIATYILPMALSRFMRAHAGVELEIHTGAAAAVAAMVIDDQVDIALVNRPLALRDIVTIPLYQEPLIAVAAIDHPLAAGGKVTPEELGRAGLLARTASASSWELTAAYFAGCAVTPRVVVRAESTETLKRMAAAGIGIALAPELSLFDDIAANRLAVIEVDGPPLPSRAIAAIHREGAPPAASARALLDVLRTVLPQRGRPRRITSTGERRKPAERPRRE